MERQLTPNGRKVFSLYKYVSLGFSENKPDQESEKKQHGRAIFEKDAVWLASPASLNDPSDCKFNVRFYASRARKKEVLHQSLTAPEGEGLPPRVAVRRENELFSPGRRDTHKKLARWEKARHSHLKEVSERFGVLCLSALNDDVLMWSHYADSHWGICLEFRFDLYDREHRDLFIRFDQVQYQKPFPVLPFYAATPPGHKFRLATCTKSEDWAYEREWRWVDLGGPGERPLPPRLLWAVILGARMPSEDRAQVLLWNAARNRPLRVYRAKLRGTGYGIDIERVRASR